MRSIKINEAIFDSLDIWETSVYCTLLFDMDFESKEVSEITVRDLSRKSKMGPRKFREVIKSLESKGLILLSYDENQLLKIKLAKECL